jgi:HK97 family phage portal protein
MPTIIERARLALRKGFNWLAAAGDIQAIAGGIGRGPLRVPYSSSEAGANTVIASAVNYLMLNLPEPPLQFGRMLDEQTFRATPNEIAYQLVDNPLGGVLTTKRLTRRELVQHVGTSLLLDGNAYLHKLRDERGRIQGIEALSFLAVKPNIDQHSGEIRTWQVQTTKGMMDVPPEDMIHFRWGIDPDGHRGQSPLKSAMRQILSDNEIAVYTHSILKKPSISGIVSPTDGNGWNANQAEAISASLTQVASGENSGAIVALTAHARFEKTSINPADMDISVMAKLGEERICAVLRIPAVVLGVGAGLATSTYNNVQEAKAQAAEDLLVPMWLLIEDVLNDQLYRAEFNVRGGQSFTYKFDTSKVAALQEDVEKLHQRTVNLFDKNIVDRAEARAALRLPVRPEDGGVYAFQLQAMRGLPMTAPDKVKSLRKSVEEAV